MKTIDVEINGTTPLLIWCPTMEELKPTPGASRRGHTIEVPYTLRFYHHSENEPYVPFTYVDKMIKNVAKTIKQPGARGGSYFKSVSGAFTIEPEQIPLKAKPWTIFGRPLRRKDGNRLWKESIIFEDWSLRFKLLVEDWFPHEVLKRIIEEAPRIEGIGEWRPACGGRFGKFILNKWEVN